MRNIDGDGKKLCSIQADLFEKSVTNLEMSSEVFARRFMNSNVVLELDNNSFLSDSKTVEDIFADLDNQYGKTSYGSVKYNQEAMYWAGYLYRYFAYTYELSSKQVYKLLPLKEVIRMYLPYHTMDVSMAIERLLEAKNISFNENDIIKSNLTIMKHIRYNNNR